MFDFLMSAITALNDNVLWGVPMVVLMLGTGVFLLFITRGVVFSRFNVVMRYTTKTLFQRQDASEAGEGTISPFQAVCTALAATLGTGNIVGVALAVATGGPGSIFWLWLSALAGMVIKFCEVTLSVAYRTRNERGEIVGGPMYYISRGLGKTWLAMLFAAFGFLASFGIGASVQANSLAGSVNATFGVPLPVIGAVVALLAGLVLIGGITRIAQITERLVPLAAVFYLLGAAAVLVVNAAEDPGGNRPDLPRRLHRHGRHGRAFWAPRSCTRAAWACRAACSPTRRAWARRPSRTPPPTPTTPPARACGARSRCSSTASSCARSRVL